jgi:hypothetical protein
MADDHRNRVEQDANRIISWLVEHRSEFEQNGVDEATLASSVGLSEDEARRAVDYLESHEDVARLPQSLTTPPRFVLKPARGWHDILKRSAAEGQGR